MSSKPDGGAAFPAVQTSWSNGGHYGTPHPNTFSAGGMSLRDYFAGQALAAITELSVSAGKYEPLRMAASAYELADAMIAVRDK